MVLDDDFLARLVTPRTRRPVRPLDTARLAALNVAIARGGVTDRAGNAVTEPLDGALIGDGEDVVYPLRQHIPVMLFDAAIALRS